MMAHLDGYRLLAYLYVFLGLARGDGHLIAAAIVMFLGLALTEAEQRRFPQ